MAKKQQPTENTEQKWVDIPLSKLIKAPWNYKTDNAELSAKLRENMRRNGQNENLIIRELGDGTYEVVNGNHRLDVMLELGMKEAKCYNYGVISLAQAKRIAIEGNETRFDSNEAALYAIVGDLSHEFELCDLELTMPFSAIEIEAFAKELEMPEFNEVAAPSAGINGSTDQRISLVVPIDFALKWNIIKEVYGINNDQKCFENLLINFR